MKVKEEQTKTEVRRLTSSLGDVILQRDSVSATGTIVHRETTMFVPKIVTKEMECLL